MKSIPLFVGLSIIGLMLTINTFAQQDFSKKLMKELVKIEAGNYKANEYMYLKFSNNNSMQIKVAATCPISVMSRDNFISFYSTYGTMLLLATFAEANIEMPDIMELDELIGDPDITYNFVIAKNGVQIQVISADGKENITMKWDEVFSE